MTRARSLIMLAALVCAPLMGACTEATAQGQAKAKAEAKAGTWEFGIFEYATIRIEGESRERYRWITAAGMLEGNDSSVVWSAVGAKGSPKHDLSDQAVILNGLSGKGWELVNASDVSLALAGGTAFMHRYYVRRPA